MSRRLEQTLLSAPLCLAFLEGEATDQPIEFSQISTAMGRGSDGGSDDRVGRGLGAAEYWSLPRDAAGGVSPSLRPQRTTSCFSISNAQNSVLFRIGVPRGTLIVHRIALLPGARVPSAIEE